MRPMSPKMPESAIPLIRKINKRRWDPADYVAVYDYEAVWRLAWAQRGNSNLETFHEDWRPLILLCREMQRGATDAD